MASQEGKTLRTLPGSPRSVLWDSGDCDHFTVIRIRGLGNTTSLKTCQLPSRLDVVLTSAGMKQALGGARIAWNPETTPEPVCLGSLVV